MWNSWLTKLQSSTKVVQRSVMKRMHWILVAACRKIELYTFCPLIQRLVCCVGFDLVRLKLRTWSFAWILCNGAFRVRINPYPFNKQLIAVQWCGWLTLCLISYQCRIQKQRATKSESTVDQLNLANMEKDQRIAELQAIHDEQKAFLNSTAREKAALSAENQGLKTWDFLLWQVFMCAVCLMLEVCISS